MSNSLTAIATDFVPNSAEAVLEEVAVYAFMWTGRIKLWRVKRQEAAN